MASSSARDHDHRGSGRRHEIREAGREGVLAGCVCGRLDDRGAGVLVDADDGEDGDSSGTESDLLSRLQKRRGSPIPDALVTGTGTISAANTSDVSMFPSSD